jgi:hypothetical protein
MSPSTRYQAVREALFELGPLATTEEVADYVKRWHHFEFEDLKTLALYIAMVKRKMSRKGIKGIPAPSGQFSPDSNPRQPMPE